MVSVSPTAWANRCGGPDQLGGRGRGGDLGGEPAERAEPGSGQHPGEEADRDDRDEPATVRVSAADAATAPATRAAFR